MGQRQDKEIETIKERNITLKLSDADVKRICEQAGRVDITVPELLQNFIGDLTDGTYSNGSDERMLANQWFDRCWFGMFPEYTFLKFLIDCDVVEDTIDDWKEIKWYESLGDPDDLSDHDKECLEEYKECMNERFEEFRSYRNTKEKEVTLTEEMGKVIKWWEEYSQISN